MADEYILKHLQDVLDAINELEGFFIDYPRRFDVFEKDRLRICAVERKTEIMGGGHKPDIEEGFYCKIAKRPGCNKHKEPYHTWL